MDSKRRSELVEKVQNLGLGKGKVLGVLVSLDDFFIGNDDYGSIGCNLNDHPSPESFYKRLKQICSQPEVQDVLVEVTEVEEDESMWPFSERVYILTSAAREIVQGWMESLRPDEIEPGYARGMPLETPELRPGIKVYGAWWD